MEKVVETARLLRCKYGFEGYIHLKVLPGSTLAHIQEAMELADRVSVNLEAASSSRMNEMSATKDYDSDILQRQRYIRDLMEKVNLPAGQTTQLVVGAAGESDEEIFKRVLYEYKEIGVRRLHSAFSPEELPSSQEPQPQWREHRLYQMTGSTESIALSLVRSVMPSMRTDFSPTPIQSSPSPGSFWTLQWTQTLLLIGS
jgi:predicted DNA-binding helix-hairpin-helix protein